MPANAQKYWDRIGHIEIEGYGKIADGLDFKFEVEKIGDMYATFRAGVLGLSMPHIHALTEWNNIEAGVKHRGIRIYAGYSSSVGEKKLVDGYIMNAAPTSPPEMWLNIEGMTSLRKSTTVKEPRTVSGSREEVFSEVCREMGMPSRWDAVRIDRGGDIEFKIDGQISSLAERIARAFGGIVYDDDGTAVLADKHAQYIRPNYEPQVIDIDHGLIGVPSVSIVGAVIRTRLNDSFKLYSWVNLKSSIMPKANGIYLVQSKKHVGHLRGNEWYTELDTVRKGF